MSSITIQTNQHRQETDTPSLSVSIETDSFDLSNNAPITSTYRVGSNFEICVKRITHENEPFQSFELYLTGTGTCKLLLKSSKLNYQKEFVYNLSEVNPEKIHWITEKADNINLLKIRIPKRDELNRLEIIRRRRQKRDEKKKRNEAGKLRRLPPGETHPMNADNALYECVELSVMREVQDI